MKLLQLFGGQLAGISFTIIASTFNCLHIQSHTCPSSNLFVYNLYTTFIITKRQCLFCCQDGSSNRLGRNEV